MKNNKLDKIKKLKVELKTLMAEEKIKNNELNKYCNVYEKQYDKMLNHISGLRDKIDTISVKLQDELASTKSGGKFSIEAINAAKKMFDELGFSIYKK